MSTNTVKLTDKQLGLIRDALYGRYVSFTRAGDTEKANEYMDIYKIVEKLEDMSKYVIITPQ